MKQFKHWLYKNEVFASTKHIKMKYGFSTCVIEMKIKDKEIIKTNQQVTTDEKLYNNIEQHN